MNENKSQVAISPKQEFIPTSMGKDMQSLMTRPTKELEAMLKTKQLIRKHKESTDASKALIGVIGMNELEHLAWQGNDIYTLTDKGLTETAFKKLKKLDALAFRNRPIGSDISYAKWYSIDNVIAVDLTKVVGYRTPERAKQEDELFNKTVKVPQPEQTK